EFYCLLHYSGAQLVF
nr:immunoglobulin light chain junction region [Macaca mulatta]